VSEQARNQSASNLDGARPHVRRTRGGQPLGLSRHASGRSVQRRSAPSLGAPPHSFEFREAHWLRVGERDGYRTVEPRIRPLLHQLDSRAVRADA
jgi:hypothetical protein